MRYYCSCLILFLVFSCTRQKGDSTIPEHKTTTTNKPSIIVDCNLTFEEAVKGSRAPKEIIDQLKLINVRYYSTDNKIHQGQVLTNFKIADKIAILFNYMFKLKFPIAHAIPVVEYNWDDDLSMQANNTYSFCYRNESYSKHAHGMAIDINPYFNPLRWKKGYENRRNKPAGAHFNPEIPGTFYPSHPVVTEFKKLGFHWGHHFSMKYDDQHFDI